MTDAYTVAAAIFAGVVSVLLGLGLGHRFLRTSLPGSAQAAQPAAEPVAMLFRDRRLIDATSPARSLLDALPGDDDWTRLWVWLGQRFDSPQSLLDLAAAEGTASLRAGPGLSGLRLDIEDAGHGLLRVQLVDSNLEQAGIVVNAHALAAMEAELAVLRESVDRAPVLIWREDRQGSVTWANAAYLQETEARHPDETSWPLPRLIALPPDAKGTLRAELCSDDRVRWFDCHLHPAGQQRAVFAVPADDAVRAERSLREFVQTLTKTFADLPIGLAIFDRDRRLQLFNPALIDLTRLNIGFLAARPTLFALLDGLRELRMVPEPRDYNGWRNSMATLEAGAASGLHVETWNLPGGQTYRVTGRPHPDGAIAFLFEDISSEVALTRRFRAELSLGAEILDGIDAAVAIFDNDGRVLGANRAFDDTWGVDAAQSLRGYLELWRRTASDSPGFQNLRRALAAERGDAPLQGAIAGPDQGLLSWRVRPLSGGRRMVNFAAAMTGAGAPAGPGMDPDVLRGPGDTGTPPTPAARTAAAGG